MNLARNIVFEMVRGDILACRLMPGEELREAELAQRYGVSKSPVRDAMRKLEAEGLIEIEPRRGHRVRPVSVGDAEDILELRVILETSAIRKIARTASAAELTSLDRFRAPDTSSIESFAIYNRDFHSTLGQMSGNRRLAEEMRRLMEMYDRLCMVSLANKRGGSFEEPLADHVAIIDALQRRDATAAARRLEKHVGRSRASLMRGLGQRPIIG